MYCLVVDDERQTREGLQRLIPWRSIGIDRVEYATSGRDALQKIHRETPDLVLCDVRMPHMNGVELLRTLREEGNPIPFIFMSGFSDKDYLMAAIRYHAVEYIEKPISIPLLTNVLADTVQKLGAESLHADPHLALRMVQHGADISEIREQMAKMAHPLLRSGLYYAGWLVQPQDRPGLSFTHLRFLLGTWGWPLVIDEGSPQHQLLVIGDKDNQQPDFALLLEKVNRTGGGYSLAVSRPVDDLSALPDAMLEARLTATRTFFQTSDVLYPRVRDAEAAARITDACINTMQEHLRLSQYQSLIDALSQMEDSLRACEGIYPEDATAQLDRVCQMLTQHVSVPIRALMDGDEQLSAFSREIHGAATLREAAAATKAWVNHMIANYLALSEHSPAIARALRYISEHYAQHVTADDLARAAFVSSSHLSFLFRQELGCTIKQYLTDVRIQRARSLLRDPMTRLGDIPDLVGIGDPSYFAKLFRKAEGITPSKYREDYMNK